MIAPIRPEEVVDAKIRLGVIPEQVIEVFNTLIAKHMSGSSARVPQNEVIAMIISRLNCSRDSIFTSRYLDVEDVYRASGWSVYYDKPGYNESYDAYFEFKKPK